jgi:hypothetical protein
MNIFKKAPTLTSISHLILHAGFILLTYSIAIPSATGQSVIGTASNKGLINNQLHEWSVGEMCAVSTATTPALILTQGFLQATTTAVSTDELALIFTGITVMPNPTSAIATLRGHAPEGTKSIAFLLLDAKGALLQTACLTPQADGAVQQDIDLTPQPSGTYFLNIQISNATKTFSIIKL